MSEVAARADPESASAGSGGQKRKRNDSEGSEDGDKKVAAVVVKKKEKEEEILEIKNFPQLYGRRNLGDPDVEVLVGNSLFRHHSLILCYASEYFDCMLSSGMQEAQTKRIEFRDKNPDEWRIVYKFFEPRSHESDAAIKGISTTNKFLVQWFHMFNMNKLLVECDDVLSKELTSSRSSQAMSYHIEWLSFAHLYNLRMTQRTLAGYIGNALANASASRHVETFKVPDLQQLAPLIGDIDRLWQAVRTYFSTEFWERNSKESLLSNPLFGDHLNTLMENKRLNNRMVEETRERLVAGLGMEERRVAMESMLRRGDRKSVV